MYGVQPHPPPPPAPPAPPAPSAPASPATQLIRGQAWAVGHRYLNLQYIGEGAYGVVVAALDVKTQCKVAIKKISPFEHQTYCQRTLREIKILNRFQHENIIDIRDILRPLTVESLRDVYIVQSLMETDLYKLLKTQRLSNNHICYFLYQILRGLKYIHSANVLHRDLKLSNLLMTDKGIVKIADFGLARAYTLPIPKYTHEVVTVWYRPLEILLGSSLYSVPVDMWGVGCILAEMATGSPLFCGDSEIDTIFKIFQKLGTPTSDQWPGVADLPDFKMSFPKWKPKGWENIRNTRAQIGMVGIDLLEKFMIYDPRKRLSARRGLQHPYFVDVEVPEPAE